MSYVLRHGRHIEVKTLDTGIAPKTRRRSDAFAQVPLALAAAMAKATENQRAMVLIVLIYEAWRANGKPFKLSNEILAPYGVTRYVKYRALLQLEKAGIIRVAWKSGRAPVIKLQHPIPVIQPHR